MGLPDPIRGASRRPPPQVAETRVRMAEHLLGSFAEHTGVVGQPITGARYLWTDAFAVMGFLALHQASGETRHLDTATRLVELVHHELGRHRGDEDRRGWLSGLSPEEGERHPTLGGLRIGKPRPERPDGEPIDEPSEWDRDGQYFHYLTKWMDALERMARVTGDLHHLRHAVELADVAHRAFLVKEPGRRRIHWKMSIDLSRPLVPAMGRQDALDGLATYGRLEAARRARADAAAALPDLRAAIEDFHDLCRGVRWETDDELGIGGLLMAATALMDLVAAGDLEHPRVLDDVLADAERSLRALAGVRDFREAAGSRLAFRELGLAIGLQAAESMREALERGGKRFERPPWLGARLRTLASREDLGGRIRTFWIEPAHRQGRTWTQHQHINAVMLAASLVPEVCLGRLGGLDARSTSSLARERTP